MEITRISKSIDMERLTSKRATLLGIGTWQYVKDVFYVNLSQNRRKVKVKGVYVDVINIYDLERTQSYGLSLGSRTGNCTQQRSTATATVRVPYAKCTGGAILVSWRDVVASCIHCKKEYVLLPKLGNSVARLEHNRHNRS